MRAFKVIVNGSAYEVEIEELPAGVAVAHPLPPAAIRETHTAHQSRQSVPASKPAMKAAPQGGAGSTIVAQMPGTIVDIFVKAGESVTRGQHLLVLEAMKMANQVVAHQDGTVTEISVKPGDLVNTGDVLVILS